MTFLNQALLFGAAAFAIPLILHILNRSRFRTIEWGAMHLLESVVKVNHRRFQIEQLLLLLVRCAIPLLLALCLARPVLTGWRTLAQDEPVSLVVLLDTSYSMDATREGQSRFDLAVDAACSIIAAAGRGSDIAVIQTGGHPVPLLDTPVFDGAAVVQRLRQLQARNGANDGASDITQAVDLGLATLAGMSHARREMIVISDFQTADWAGMTTDAAQSITRQFAALSVEPTLTLLNVGQSVDGNIAVASLDFSTRAIGPGQPLSVRATVRNFAAAAEHAARVVLRVDGEDQSVSQVELSGNAETQVLFPCRIESSGSHVMEVEVIADDPLANDNRYAAAVTIHERIPVLLIDGDPSSQPLKGESDFLAVALTPYTFGRLKLADLIETKTMSVGDFKTDSLADVQVVVLANVQKLNDAQVTAITGLVRNGGALLVFAGNRLDVAWYNQTLFAGGIGLLPAPFGELRGQVDGQGQSSRIVAEHFDHPALQFFNLAANGDLSTAEIRQWLSLAIDTGTTSDAAVVLARLDSGDPLLIEKSFGDGVVVQAATACDADWSDLPMRPVFVPLMQQLVTTLAFQITPPRNIDTGEPAVALFPQTTDDASISVLTPAGSRRTVGSVTRDAVRVARFDDTRQPGVYTMSTPAAGAIHFVARTSRDESNLAVLDGEQIAEIAARMNGQSVRTVADYLEQDRLRRHGREIWKPVLMVLLAFMFLELILQQRFSRVHT